MTNSQTYRATAATMRRRAAGAGTPEHRAAWAQMAARWEELANEVEVAAMLEHARTGGDWDAADESKAPEQSLSKKTF